jgi:hypothetical protein
VSEIAQFYRVFICMWTYLLCSYDHVSLNHNAELPLRPWQWCVRPAWLPFMSVSESYYFWIYLTRVRLIAINMFIKCGTCS